MIVIAIAWGTGPTLAEMAQLIGIAHGVDADDLAMCCVERDRFRSLVGSKHEARMAVEHRGFSPSGGKGAFGPDALKQTQNPGLTDDWIERSAPIAAAIGIVNRVISEKARQPLDVATHCRHDEGFGQLLSLAEVRCLTGSSRDLQIAARAKDHLIAVRMLCPLSLAKSLERLWFPWPRTWARPVVVRCVGT